MFIRGFISKSNHGLRTMHGITNTNWFFQEPPPVKVLSSIVIQKHIKAPLGTRFSGAQLSGDFIVACLADPITLRQVDLSDARETIGPAPLIIFNVNVN